MIVNGELPSLKLENKDNNIEFRLAQLNYYTDVMKIKEKGNYKGLFLTDPKNPSIGVVFKNARKLGMDITLLKTNIINYIDGYSTQNLELKEKLKKLKKLIELIKTNEDNMYYTKLNEFKYIKELNEFHNEMKTEEEKYFLYSMIIEVAKMTPSFEELLEIYRNKENEINEMLKKIIKDSPNFFSFLKKEKEIKKNKTIVNPKQ